MNLKAYLDKGHSTNEGKKKFFNNLKPAVAGKMNNDPTALIGTDNSKLTNKLSKVSTIKASYKNMGGKLGGVIKK